MSNIKLFYREKCKRNKITKFSNNACYNLPNVNKFSPIYSDSETIFDQISNWPGCRQGNVMCDLVVEVGDSLRLGKAGLVTYCPFSSKKSLCIEQRQQDAGAW